MKPKWLKELAMLLFTVVWVVPWAITILLIGIMFPLLFWTHVIKSLL